MPKLSLLAWIGNAAAVLFGKHGDITAQADAAGCSRQAAYAHAEKVQQAVAVAQVPGPGRDELRRQVRDLRQQVQDLRRQLRDERRRRDSRVELGRDRQRRAAVTLHAMGLSLNQIADALALFLPPRRAPRRATVGHWVREAEHQAGRVLGIVDVCCQKHVRSLCLDEIFFHRQPCLVGVEPLSMALLLCHRAKDRTAVTWHEALRPFTRLEYAVADAGTGLQAGLEALDAQRRQANEPAVERGLDHFHTEQEAQRLLARVWKHVEARWAQAGEVDRKRVAAALRGRDGRGLAARARAAWKRAFASLAWYDARAAAWQRVRQALGLYKPDGQLNDRASAQAEITAAGQALGGRPWKKVDRLLRAAAR